MPEEFQITVVIDKNKVIFRSIEDLVNRLNYELTRPNLWRWDGVKFKYEKGENNELLSKV